MANALQNVFSQNFGVEGNCRSEFLQQGFISPGLIWTIYLVVRLLDEGFHVVVPSEHLPCLGATVYFQRFVLAVFRWR